MPKFAVLSRDFSGHLRVRAVIDGGYPSDKIVSGHEIVRIDPGEDASRLIGRLYFNGEFVCEGVLLKRKRTTLLRKAEIRQIVWCHNDFGYGNSLGHVSRETVRWLQRNNVPVKVFHRDGIPVPGFPTATPEELQWSAVIVMDRDPPSKQTFLRLKEAPFLAGYYMLEGTRARPEELDRLEGYDVVFVPSEFCRKALVDSGLSTPVHVWGHGVDHEIFPYIPPKPGRPFTFLWFGDENRRKGYDLFLEAFSRLEIPDVRAWVRSPGTGGIAYLKGRYRKDPRIIWDTRITPPLQLQEMMAEADVIVSPYRGEGFGLCVLEAMASGRPAIATRWSGPLDFGGGDDLTYWIDPEGWEPAQNDGGIQAIPSMESLVKAMRRCAETPKEVLERGIRASRYVHENWRWERKVMEILPVLRSRVPRCML